MTKRRIRPKICSLTIATLLMVVTLSFSVLFLEFAYGNPQIGTLMCGRSVNSVTVDGKWTTSSEWADAVEVKIANDSRTLYIRIKHDADYIYVLLDYTTDSAIEYAVQNTPEKPYDAGAIMFDTNHTGGATPQTDDYLFGVRWNSPTTYMLLTRQGEGPFYDAWSDPLVNPAGFIGASSMNATNDPYNPNPHLIYELRVPISYLGQKTVYGVAVLATDGNVPMTSTYFFIGWPFPFTSASLIKPDAWGDINMTEQAVPEFSAGTVFIAAVALASTVLLVRIKRKSG